LGAGAAAGATLFGQGAGVASLRAGAPFPFTGAGAFAGAPALFPAAAAGPATSVFFGACEVAGSTPLPFFGAGGGAGGPVTSLTTTIVPDARWVASGAGRSG
jgi:hypothetical protein